MAEDLISIAKCAERLTAEGDTIERSALSRYIKNHGLPTRKFGRENRVSFSIVRDHRRANVMRRVMRGQDIDAAPPPATPPSSTLFDARSSSVPAAASQPPAAAPEPEPHLTAGPGAAAEPGDQGEGDAAPEPAGLKLAAEADDPDKVASLDPRRRMYEVKARTAEREELEALGRLTPAEEVEAGLADALASMRQHAKVTVRDAASRAAADLGLDARAAFALRRHLQTYQREVENRFADECARLMRESGEARSEARRRLSRIAAFALKTRGLAASARAMEREQA